MAVPTTSAKIPALKTLFSQNGFSSTLAPKTAGVSVTSVGDGVVASSVVVLGVGVTGDSGLTPEVAAIMAGATAEVVGETLVVDPDTVVVEPETVVVKESPIMPEPLPVES